MNLEKAYAIQREELLTLRRENQKLRREGAVDRQTDGLPVAAQPGLQAFRGVAEPFREARCEDNAHRHGLAVGDIPPRKPGAPLDGVGESMSEVEFAALAPLVEVRRHDALLDGGRGEEEIPGAGPGLTEGGNRLFVAVAGIVDQEGLQELRRAAAPFPLRECLQKFRNNEGEFRLPDHAEHILVGVQIDAVLAADGRVHLGEERGRDEAEPDPPPVNGGRKSAQVRHDPAAEGDQRGPPVRAERQQPAADIQHGIHRFPRLRRVNRPGRQAHSLQLRGDIRKIAVIHQEHVAFQQGSDVLYPPS